MNSINGCMVRSNLVISLVPYPDQIPWESEKLSSVGIGLTLFQGDISFLIPAKPNSMV